MEAFRAVGGRIVALIDPSPHVQSMARAAGAEVFDSPAQLHADEVDLVVVSLPSSLQPGVSADLLRRGLRVLVEKPVGSSSLNAAVLGEIPNIEDDLMVGYSGSPPGRRGVVRMGRFRQRDQHQCSIGRTEVIDGLLASGA